MTIYTTPESFEDSIPSPGQRFGEAIGQGLNSGLELLVQQKIKGLQDRKKAIEEYKKGFGELSSSISKFAKDTGREGYGYQDFDSVRKIAEEFYNQGDSKDTAAAKAWIKYEEEPQTGIEYLKKGQREGYKTPPTTARFTDLFKPKETEESKELANRSSEKAKTAKSLDEFTLGELLSLKPSDVENLPKEEQEKFWKAAPFLSKRMEGISSVAALPFIGGALEERARKQIDPNLPGPPGIATASRIAGELPFLGPLLEGATVAQQAIRGGATFGGEAAINEFIRTIGTDKPVDLKSIGIQTGLGALFPYGEKGIKKLSKPFRTAIAKRMQKGATTGIEATESLLKDADKAGISIEELQKGSEVERIKFQEFLDNDAKKTAEKTKELVKPEAMKASRKETIKGRAETPKEATKRFSKETQALAETPIEKYLTPSKVTKGYNERISKLGPRVQQTKKRIEELEKGIKNKIGTELTKAQEEIASLRERNYKLDYEIKYGTPPPTNAELTEAADKSVSQLVDMIMNPTEDTLKKIQKNDKMMNTFLDREKNEIVKGKLPGKIVEGTFLKVQDSHLKAYKDLQKEIRNQMLTPYSPMRGSGLGQTILDQLEKRIKGIEAAQKVQSQKRKVQSALKGPTGKFYRNWVDQLKGEQKLFYNDMIRIGEKISKAEKNLTPIARERIEKAAAEAMKKGEKEVIKQAQQAGFGKTESIKIGKSLEEIKNPPKNLNSKEKIKEWIKPRVNNILKTPIKTQIMTGFILGSLDSIMKETTGKKIPSKIKTPIFYSAGIGSKLSVKKPILSITAFLVDGIFNNLRIKHHKEKLQSKKGIERLQEYEKIKNKKGFSPKELKKIRN